MKRILVTGAAGQIGSELVPALRRRHGLEQVVASDIRDAPHLGGESGYFEHLDCTRSDQVEKIVRRYEIGTIYHLASLLSAVAEREPQRAWAVNMGGLYHVLETARRNLCSVFFPSSIAVFGPGTPKVRAPQDTILRPTTIYGVTKVAGELLCDYYHRRYGTDTRGVRYPGLISHVAMPGGGTTDYAVDIFHHAVRHQSYCCYLDPDTSLDMVYMPDAIRAAMELMEVEGDRLRHRNAFNLTAMTVTPALLAREIQKHITSFTVSYEIDPMRQAIAESWPDSVDDSVAREEWGWMPEFDLERMARDMLANLGKESREPESDYLHRGGPARP